MAVADQVASEIELAEAPPPASKKKLILFLALGILLLSGATVATLYFAGVLSGAESTSAADAGPGAQAPDKEKLKPAVYVGLDPAFTVNFQNSQKGQPRLLQVSVQAMTRDPEVEELIKLHMPRIRNNLVMLFSSQSAVELGTREGKEKLQLETLESIQSAIEAETGRKGVEAVYFTSFVMQ